MKKLLILLAIPGSLSVAIAVPVMLAIVSGVTSQVCNPDTVLAQTVITAQDGLTIIGPAAVSETQMLVWWQTGHTRPQPPTLTVPINVLIHAYYTEATAEGVRPDVMFAQSVLETGSFTNGDTARNNFAGIAHYDGAAAGRAFPTAVGGVRAQAQLLHKIVAGNNVVFANPDEGVKWGVDRHTDVWDMLGGYPPGVGWATDTHYWQSIASVYSTMLQSAGLPWPPSKAADSTDDDPTTDDAAATTVTTGSTFTTAPVTSTSATAPGDVAGSGCGQAAGTVTAPGASAPLAAGFYALPLPRDHLNPAALSQPHHNYPAIDLMTAQGTPVYAIAAGTVITAQTFNKNWYTAGCTEQGVNGCATCGVGLTIRDANGYHWTYCHMSQALTGLGATIAAGQNIGISGDTGRSGAPHLHIEIRVDNTQHCPQRFLQALYNGVTPTAPANLPTTGCWFGADQRI